MKLPLSIAKKMLQLLEGYSLPFSQLQKQWREKLLEEGILSKKTIGRTKAKLKLNSRSALQHYLANQYRIDDLSAYIHALEKENLSGTEAQAVASDTKLRKTDFTGFLVNSLSPVSAKLGSQEFTIHPPKGSFLFIEDYTSFTIPEEITVVGIENPENFKNLESNTPLFGVGAYNPLFVCRYPQSSALINWLQRIPNPYIHFGDFDLAGIAIYEREFKKFLGDRASFLIPKNIRKLIKKHGNRKLYNQQYEQYRNLTATEPEVQALLNQIHELKMGLEQEFFIDYPGTL